MERRWPWKKKSSDKAAHERAATAAALESATVSLVSVGSIPNQQENYKIPNYVQISVESYTHLTELENQVKTYKEQYQTLESQIKTYEEQFQTLEIQIEELNEKLSQAWSEVENKENLLKQHAKVAEDAVVGWEKAETEMIALQSQVDSLKFAKRATEDRADHLDGVLKEYMQEIRNMKDGHAQELRDVIFSKTKQWDKIKYELEKRIANLDHQLLMADAENAALLRSLQERGNYIVQINDEKSQAEAEIELLKGKLGSCERDISSLAYELHVASIELEIRTEEKNMSVKSANVANQQYLEGVKKIAKLEDECQRMRGLVRKKLPGPAALAQMRSEVETLGTDYGNSRTRRASKPSGPYSPLHEYNFDNSQKFQKDNEFLQDRLLAMEEEMKMLKEALAKRNSELLASRNECSKTATKLLSLETQLPSQNNNTKFASTTCSLASMAGDCVDDSVSCADSWTTASASELHLSKKDKFVRPKKSDGNQLELMDDFLEMEKLAYTSLESNGSVNPDHLAAVMSSVHVTSQHADIDPDQSPLLKLRTSILSVFESLSMESEIAETVESINSILQRTHPLHSRASECAVAEIKCSDFTCINQCCPQSDRMTTVLANSSSQSSSKVLLSVSEDVAVAISQIHDFMQSLGNEIHSVRASSGDINGLVEKFEKFSIVVDDILHGNGRLNDFVVDLAHILKLVNKFSLRILAPSSSDLEANGSDCVDKAALPENNLTYSHLAHSRNPTGCSDISDAPYPELPSSIISASGMESNKPYSSSGDSKELLLSNERLAKNLVDTKAQLVEAEQLIVELKSQLAAAEKSNILSETRLKCMTESYRSLEKKASELESEVDLLREKTKSLEFEIEKEKKNNQNTLETCSHLHEQFERNKGIVASSEYGTEYTMQQEIELAAAAEKLAKCQETISQLGKQFESLRPRAEVLGSPQSEKSQTNERDQTEKRAVACQWNQTGNHSATKDVYVNTSNSETTILPKSPTTSKLPNHKHTMSGSTLLSSTPNPEKHNGSSFRRIFTSKRNM